MYANQTKEWIGCSYMKSAQKHTVNVQGMCLISVFGFCFNSVKYFLLFILCSWVMALFSLVSRYYFRRIYCFHLLGKNDVCCKNYVESERKRNRLQRVTLANREYECRNEDGTQMGQSDPWSIKRATFLGQQEE